MLEIPIDRASRSPLYLQIAEHLKWMIAEGALEPGFRLPSSRELAASLKVSRTTANAVYRWLEAEGLIQIRGRSGAYVVEKSPPLSPCEGKLPPEWDLFSGSPSPSLLPLSRLYRILKESSSKWGPCAFYPMDMEGSTDLRRALVRHAVTRGIPARWEELLVTSGGKEALPLCFRSLFERGVSKLFVEGLTYPDAVHMALEEGLEVLPLPFEERELVESLEDLEPESALYLIPSFHNPTGRTLSLAARQAILEATAKKGCWIIEDDTYGELRYGGESVPAMKAARGAERVCYLGSFSQLLFPGIRLGYILLPEEMREPFLRFKALRSGPTSSLAQHLILDFIEEGGLEESLETTRQAMGVRMRQICRWLDAFLPKRLLERPQGGIFLWILTDPLSGKEAAQRLLEKGVKVAPGEDFLPQGGTICALRLAISRFSAGEMEPALRILASVLNLS